MANDKKNLSGIGRSFEDLITQARNKQDLFQKKIEDIQNNPKSHLGDAAYRKEMELRAQLHAEQRKQNDIVNRIKQQQAAQEQINQRHGADDLFDPFMSEEDINIARNLSPQDALEVGAASQGLEDMIVRAKRSRKEISTIKDQQPSTKMIANVSGRFGTYTERVKQRISDASLNSNPLQGIYKKANTADNKIAAVAAVRRGIHTSEIDKTTNRLQDEFKNLINERAEYGEANLQAIMDDPNGPESQHINKLQQRETELTKQIGFQDVLKTTQHQMGLSSGQIITDTQHKADVAQNRMGSSSLFSSLSPGSNVSAGQAEKNLIKAASDFTEAVKKMNKAIDEGADNVEDLGAAAKEAADNYGEATDVERLARQKNIDRAGGIGSKTAMIGAGLSTFGNAYSYGAVGSENRQLEIKAQLANYSNRQYQDVNAATAGDGAAIMRLLSNQYGSASEFGDSQGTDATVGSTFDLTGQIVTTGGATVAGTLLGGLPGALAGATSGAGGISNLIADISRGNVRGGAAITGANAKIILGDAVNLVGADMFTRTIQHSASMALGTRGMGSNRNAMFNTGQDNDFIKQMGALGIDPAAMPELFMQAQGAFGSDLSKVRSGIQSAASYTQQGYFSNTAQAMQIGGDLAKVGGTDLKDIIREAVGTGMDSSKHIQEMAAGISGLSSSSMLAGIDTSGSMLGILSRSNDALGAAGFSVNQRNAMSNNAAGTINQMFKDDSLNLQNMGALEILNNSLGGAKTSDKQSLMSLGLGEVGNISNASSAEELNDIFSQLGVNFNVTDENFKNVQGDIGKAYRHKAFSKAAGGYSYFEKASRVANEAFTNNLQPGSKEYQALLDKHGVSAEEVADATTRAAVSSGMSADSFNSIGRVTGGKFIGPIQKPEGNVGEDNISLQTGQNAKLLAESLSALAASDGGLKKVSDALRVFSENTSLEKFAEQAKDNAKNMKLGSEAITKATDSAKDVIKTFETSLSSLIKQMVSGEGTQIPSENHNTPGKKIDTTPGKMKGGFFN